MLIGGSWAFADPPPDMAETIEKMKPFQSMLKSMMGSIMADKDLKDFVTTVWTAFAVFMLVGILIKFAFEGVQEIQLFHTILVIIFTKVCIDMYDYVTGVFWAWSEGLAGGIQKAVLGSSDPFLIAAFLNDCRQAITWSKLSLLDGANIIVFGIVTTLIVCGLSIVSFLASSWALWGYGLAKIIGWFFLPFVMLKKTAFIFDGWVRFFLGFLIYGVIARANLLMTLIAVRCYFGLPSAAVPYTLPTKLFDIKTEMDGLGLMAFLLVSLLSLICTGKFAATIVSGAGGFGDGLQTLAYTVARITTSMKGGK